MKYYLKALENYSGFDGRATRTEFWVFGLFCLIFIVTTVVLDHLLGTCFKYDMGYGVRVLPFGYIFAMYCLATLIPTLALHVRRLHDIGKSGWFLFIVLIPVIGAIWLLVLYGTDSNAGYNKYGPAPKQSA